MQHPHMEFGTFSFSYRTLGVHGIGISASSNFAVLYEAMRQFLKGGPPLCQENIAAAALQFERRLALGLAVAADDVYAITYGGVMKIFTDPMDAGVKSNGNEATARVKVEPIPHDPRWLSERVVVAFNPLGARHVIPDLLDRLFKDRRKARKYIRKFSALAEIAATAISDSHRPRPNDKSDERSIRQLADAMNAYRDEFDKWTKEAEKAEKTSPRDQVSPNHTPLYTRAVDDTARKLVGKLGKEVVLGWKPPGGGASESLIVLTPDIKGRDAVIDFFRSHKPKWTALPAYVTPGICGEFVKANGEVRISAGHRLDFVGAADLGQDPRIGIRGCCCSCAIEPRTEIVLSSTGKPIVET
jgi:hypothetical protein